MSRSDASECPPATTRRPVIMLDPPLRNRFQPRLSDWIQRIRATGPLHLPDEDPIRPHTSTLLGDCNNLVAQIGTGPKEMPEAHSSGVAHCGTPLNSYRLAAAKNHTGKAGVAGAPRRGTNSDGRVPWRAAHQRLSQDWMKKELSALIYNGPSGC